MARAATGAASPKPSAPRGARQKPAPPAGKARRSARHAGRRRAPAARRSRAPRRLSGPAAAPAVALPARVLRAPFARAARRGTSGILDALLAGRGWIALVFVLLSGIVFFNVDLLQMNREIAGNDEKISALKREIARNRLDVARLASSERIQESAAKLGLVLPAPGDVRYLKARPRLDSRQAAKRISAPNTAYVPPDPIDTTPEPVAPATDPTATDPAASPTAPAATDPAAADPAATDPTATPAPTTTATPVG
jgi:cell division protein FtsL